MHLALAIGGCTLAELEQRMTEREFQLWRKYARKFLLPDRRQEWHGAQTAMIIARTMGNVKGNVTMRDFMYEREDEPEVNATTGGNILGAVASVGVRRLGQGRKKKVT